MTERKDEGSASALGREAKEAGRDARDRAEGHAHEAAEQMRAEKDRLAERARGQAEGAKQGAANEASKIATALRHAGDELDADTYQGRMFHEVADGIDSLAETTRGKEVDQLASEVTTFARTRPMTFLGGAALIGFAVSRFATATERRRDIERFEADPPPLSGQAPGASEPSQPEPRHTTDPL